jgi:LysR family transcriptional regulator, transcriptional activator of the cysJI operon
MQIEGLKVFCDLAETESFTKAARLNEVTQSAVSQQISSMERHFQSLLIERSRKKFRLTQEGQTLYEHCKQILHTFEALHKEMQATKETIARSIRVATIYSIGLYDLPTCLKQFLKTHPTVHVHVNYRRPQQVYADVLDSVVDVGLVAYPARDIRLEVVPLRKEPLTLVCHPQNPLAKTKKLKLKDLSGQKLVGFVPDVPTRRAVDKLFKKRGAMARYVTEFDNLETVKRAVEIDEGVAILPRNTVAPELAKHTLAEVKLEDADAAQPIVAIHKRNTVLSPSMTQFLAALKG